jgi:PEP-CTERM motif-containing protein
MQAKTTLVNVGLLISYVLLGPAFASADTTFNVAGQYTFPGSGTFSGTLTVNTASGTLDGVNISFTRTFPFNSIVSSLPGSDGWNLTATNASDQVLAFGFSTSPTAQSLAGLTAGTIVNGTVLESAAGGAVPIFANFSGSITPAISVPAPVPEPSSLALLALAFFPLLPFAFARKGS